VKEYLSVGAKEEIYLAARLAIARFITRGVSEPIPILLDEPLSSADDQKFRSGMKFFLEELSRHHQVIILTCHEERHQWLRGQAPDLFDDRVHLISLSQYTPVAVNLSS
ncbi:MAG: ATP-binding protein, partial [bacterium]